jgi:hypothetical protein
MLDLAQWYSLADSRRLAGQFLSYLPENQGGLFPVGVGLLHPSGQVRRSTAALFDRIAKFKVRTFARTRDRRGIGGCVWADPTSLGGRRVIHSLST